MRKRLMKTILLGKFTRFIKEDRYGNKYRKIDFDYY